MLAQALELLATHQSLTDGCRAVLRMSVPSGVTPREVKHLLTQSGVSWKRFSNPMSAIHPVLKRLVQQHEAVATIGRDGQRRYAVKRTVAIALTRRQVDDNALMKKLLEANSPLPAASPDLTFTTGC